MNAAKPKAVIRDTVMISHANPEDNEFTLWLALQLARDGYKVWSDVTDLLGGDQFWSDIERVIRERAVKFVYVLSRISNESNRGFRKELHLADSEARKIANEQPRFIIPVAIDDLPSSDYNVYVQQLNAVQAQQWSEGLNDILKILQKDNVPRFCDEFNAPRVGEWWRNFRSAKAGMTRTRDQYLSNWLAIESLPPVVYWHTVQDDAGNAASIDFDLPFCFVQRGNYVLTFADQDEMKSAIKGGAHVVATDDLDTTELQTLQADPNSKEPNPKFMFLELLRDSWEKWIESKGLGIYELSNRAKCFFFRPQNGSDALRVSFRGMDRQQTWRALIGTFTRHPANAPQESIKHFWHFGIQAKPRLWPYLVFQISSHVVFSDDGQHIWESKKRLHSARRRQCKGWYNDEWRDRLLATMSLLANGEPQFTVPFSPTKAMQVSTVPLAFESKIKCEPLSKDPGLAEDDEPDDGEDEADFEPEIDEVSL